MRSLLLLGAIIGFIIGLLFGLADNGVWPSALWRASSAALVAAILMRWWGRVWVRALREAAERRLADRNLREETPVS